MSRRALFASALALLALSLAIKWQVASGARAIDEPGFASTIAARLENAGYETRIMLRFGAPVVVASKGDCRLLIRHALRIAHRARTYEQVAKPYGGLSYRWSGAWTATPPIAQLTVRTLLQEQLARLGVDTSRAALVAVAGTPRCRAVLPNLDGLAIGTMPIARKP